MKVGSGRSKSPVVIKIFFYLASNKSSVIYLFGEIHVHPKIDLYLQKDWFSVPEQRENGKTHLSVQMQAEVSAQISYSSMTFLTLSKHSQLTRKSNAYLPSYVSISTDSFKCTSPGYQLFLFFFFATMLHHQEPSLPVAGVWQNCSWGLWVVCLDAASHFTGWRCEIGFLFKSNPSNKN